MPKDKALSGEDRILWGKVARSTRALPGKLDALTEFEEAFAEKVVEQEPEPAPRRQRPKSRRKASRSPSVEAGKPAITRWSAPSSARSPRAASLSRRASTCTA